MIGGSLLGTAIITAALVVGATFESSVRDIARTQLGPLDERVVTQTAGQQADVTRSLRDRPPAGTDGVLPVAWSNVSVSTVGTERRAEPGRRMFEFDFDQARRFGTNSSATGLAKAGPTPGPGDAVLNRDLAGALGVSAGQQVKIYAYGSSVTLRVRQVVPQVGLAGTGSLFVEPGTGGRFAASRAGARPAGLSEPVHTEVLVSNQGGVFSGADRTAAVSAELRGRTRGLTGVSVDPTKREVLDHAVSAGQNIGSLFTLVGLFSVLAGVLLLVNLFVMVAEERKPELGMLRAVGLRRHLLMRAFTLEGACYGIAASVLGVAVGGALGHVMVIFTKGLFAGGNDDLTLRFSAPARLLVTGGAIGLAILLATAYATSGRIARLNVISAIRDLPDPRHRRHRLRRLLAGALGLVVGGVATAVGLLAGVPLATLLGPPLCAAAAVPLLQGVAGRRWASGVLAALGLVWCLFAFTLAPDAMSGGGVEVFAVQGILLVAAAVVIAANVDRFWVVAVEHLGRVGGGLAARLGLAYPLARRFRTAMLLAMYALVMFTITFLATFGHILGTQEQRYADSARAGTDLVVSSNPANPVPRDELLRQPKVASAAPLVLASGKVRNAKHPDETASVSGFDVSLLERGVPRLSARSGRYPTDRAAYEAVLHEPNTAIVSGGLFGQRESGPRSAAVAMGSTITVTDPNGAGTRDLRVVGSLQHDPAGDGILLSSTATRELFGAHAVADRYFVTVAPGANATVVGQQLNADLVAYGVKATTFRALIHRALSTELGLFTLMEGYLGLGLVIGIAGLGVVMIRAVRERRHEIGMLRAIGFQAGVVRRAFLVESTYIALQGVLIGVGTGLLTAHQILSDNGLLTGEALPFSVPWGLLGMVSVIPLVGSLAAAIIPAGTAAAIRPAVALRLAD